MTTVWQINGKRTRPDGSTSELLATAFGADDAAARRNFERSQAKLAQTHPELTVWQLSELTFTPVEQVEPI